MPYQQEKPVMGQAVLLAQIVSIISAVSGIGVVHDYERYSRSFAEWQALMTSGGIINGWTVSREKTDVENRYPTILNRHIFKIKGYYRLDDPAASEATLQALVNRIKTAFNSKKTLNGVALNSDPVTVDSITIKELAPEYFVHIAELTLQAEEREWI
jgi:hypothetical protein